MLLFWASLYRQLAKRQATPGSPLVRLAFMTGFAVILVRLTEALLGRRNHVALYWAS
jgi:hypothetical protein